MKEEVSSSTQTADDSTVRGKTMFHMDSESSKVRKFKAKSESLKSIEETGTITRKTEKDVLTLAYSLSGTIID